MNSYFSFIYLFTRRALIQNENEKNNVYLPNVYQIMIYISHYTREKWIPKVYDKPTGIFTKTKIVGIGDALVKKNIFDHLFITGNRRKYRFYLF